MTVPYPPCVLSGNIDEKQIYDLLRNHYYEEFLLHFPSWNEQVLKMKKNYDSLCGMIQDFITQKLSPHSLLSIPDQTLGKLTQPLYFGFFLFDMKKNNFEDVKEYLSLQTFEEWEKTMTKLERKKEEFQKRDSRTKKNLKEEDK